MSELFDPILAAGPVRDEASDAAWLRALLDVEAALAGAEADAGARLAREHVSTAQAGRTLLQQALPVTFGLTAAGWLSGLDAAAGRLRSPRLAVQLGGATGTLASLGDAGPAVLAAFSKRLG